MILLSNPLNETEPDINDCFTSSCDPIAVNETYIPHTERPEIYLVPIVFAIIFVVGTIGNGALLYFFIKFSHMRNSPNTYIMSLAMGDLIVTIFCVPFVSTIYTTESWMFGEFICRLLETLRDLSVGVTIFTLTTLSAERYLAIVKPVSRRAGSTHSAFTVTIIIWVLSLVMSLPAAILSNVRYFPTSDGGTIAVCTPFPEWIGAFYPKVIVAVRALVFYLLPVIIIGCFYFLMARHLMATTTALPGEAFQQRHRVAQMAARRKVAKIVLVFVFIFAICFLPNHVFLLWFYFNPTSQEDFNHFWNAFRIVGFCLGFLNSCINPVTLYFISGTFRKYFNHYLFCNSCGESIEGPNLTRLRFHSSAAGITSRTEQIDMSTFNGPEKNMIKSSNCGLNF